MARTMSAKVFERSGRQVDGLVALGEVEHAEEAHQQHRGEHLQEERALSPEQLEQVLLGKRARLSRKHTPATRGCAGPTLESCVPHPSKLVQSRRAALPAGLAPTPTLKVTARVSTPVDRVAFVLVIQLYRFCHG